MKSTFWVNRELPLQHKYTCPIHPNWVGSVGIHNGPTYGKYTEMFTEDVKCSQSYSIRHRPFFRVSTRLTRALLFWNASLLFWTSYNSSLSVISGSHKASCVGNKRKRGTLYVNVIFSASSSYCHVFFFQTILHNKNAIKRIALQRTKSALQLHIPRS